MFIARRRRKIVTSFRSRKKYQTISLIKELASIGLGGVLQTYRSQRSDAISSLILFPAELSPPL